MLDAEHTITLLVFDKLMSVGQYGGRDRLAYMVANTPFLKVHVSSALSPHVIQ